MQLKVEKVFAERDFHPSPRWRGGGHHDVFATWACSTANTSLALITAGASVAQVIDFCAKGRGMLAAEEGTANAEMFGRRRTNESVTHLRNLDPELQARAARHLNERVALPMRVDGFDILPKVVRRDVRRTIYKTLDGDEIEATWIARYREAVQIGSYRYDAGTLLLEHASAINADHMMTDVVSRIDDLFRTPNKSPEDTSRALHEVMYWFYHAMPFSRGTAAIGRVLAACFSYALKTKGEGLIRGDIDIQALTTPDIDEFIEATSPPPGTN